MAKKSLSGEDFRAPILLDGNAGTAGQVVTSQGADATPTWTTPSAGGGSSTPVIHPMFIIGGV